jgi:hypothetical protein
VPGFTGAERDAMPIPRPTADAIETPSPEATSHGVTTHVRAQLDAVAAILGAQFPKAEQMLINVIITPR